MQMEHGGGGVRCIGNGRKEIGGWIGVIRKLTVQVSESWLGRSEKQRSCVGETRRQTYKVQMK